MILKVGVLAIRGCELDNVHAHSILATGSVTVWREEGNEGVLLTS